MRDLQLPTPAAGERLSRRYLMRLAENASNVPALDWGMVGRMLSAVAPNETSSNEIVPATLTSHLLSGSSASATFLVGEDRDETGDAFTVHDKPAFISSGYRIPSGSTINVIYDPVQKRWRMVTPDACEEEVT